MNVLPGLPLNIKASELHVAFNYLGNGSLIGVTIGAI